MADFSIKRNDLLPVLDAILKDADKQPIDLTNAQSIVFHMRSEDSRELKITDGVAEFTDKPSGAVRYSWVDGDTDTEGLFLAEFEVTWNDSKIQTFPNADFISVQIIEDLS
jgi:hypothetical protein